MDDIARENSEKLVGLLQGREGWQHGTQAGEEYWYFGEHGAARLTIAPEMDGFLMVVHDQERSDGPRQSWIIPRIESVEEWLDEHEAEHAGLTPLQKEFKQAYDSRSAHLAAVISWISRWALRFWRGGEEQFAGLVAELLHLGEQVA